jgi:hypothetical protein
MPFHDAFDYLVRMVDAIKVGAEWCDIWRILCIFVKALERQWKVKTKINRAVCSGVA